MPDPVPGPKPKPKPKPGGRRVAGLPVWAWGVALAGGLLVGYVLMRRQSDAARSGDSSSGSGADAEGVAGGGATIAEPLGDDLRQALGLQGHDTASGSGGGQSGGDDYAAGDSGSWDAPPAPDGGTTTTSASTSSTSTPPAPSPTTFTGQVGVATGGAQGRILE